MRTRRYLLGAGAAALLLGLADLAPALQPGEPATIEPRLAAAERDTLVIGKVSSNPKKHYGYLKPLADYAAARMQDLGVRRAEVLMAPSNERMITYLEQGKVDWITETLFSSLIFQERAGAGILLLKWKKGVPEYHTIFIARKDSGISSLADLKGKTLALEDPGSTTAFFLPIAELLDAGLAPVPLTTPREAPQAEKVGFVFARQEITQANWVHEGFVDAAAFSNLDWEKADHNPPEFRADLKIIHRTASYPRAFELVQHNLDPARKERLKAILLNAPDTAEGRALLHAYQKTTKFDEPDAQTLQRLERARAMLKRVQMLKPVLTTQP